MRGLTLSFGLFSVLPVDVGTPDRRTVRWAVLLSPLVAAVLGLLAAGVMFGLRIVMEWRFGPSQPPTLGPLLAATIGILTLQLLTGGLHLDGLADVVDGIAARAGRERTLAIMRDSAVGAMGALALVLVIVLDIVALGISIQYGHGTEALVTAVVAARVAIVWGCTRGAARPDGLGAWVSRTTTWRSALLVSVIALLVPLVLMAFDDDPFGPAALLAAGPVGVVGGVAAVQPLIRKLGGITGDVLGAAAEVAMTTTLVTSAALLG